MSGSSTALAIGSAIAVVAWITKGLLSRFISAFAAGVEARIFACTFNRLATLYQRVDADKFTQCYGGRR